MSKFSNSLDKFLNVRIHSQEMLDITFVSRNTLREARHGRTNIRRSTAILLLSAARKITERKKRELDEYLAELEQAYEEEFKTRSKVNKNAQT